MLNNLGLPGLIVIFVIVIGIFLLVKRLRERDGSTHATEQKRYENTEQKPHTSSNDARNLDSFVKQICVAMVKGERRSLGVPDNYRDYPTGRILEAFAQGKHPDDVKQGQPTRDPSDLRAAVERLQRLAQSPFPTPELIDYFSKIDELRGRSSSTISANLNNEAQIELAVQDWDSKVPERQSRAIQTFESLVRENTESLRPYKILCTIYALTDSRGKSDEIVRMRRRICQLDPQSETAIERLEEDLFSHAKFMWDDNNSKEAFRFYIEGLSSFSQRGGKMNDSTPLNYRVAFRAARMFAKEALDNYNDANLGAELLGLCEDMGIDINHEVDISDLRPKQQG